MPRQPRKPHEHSARVVSTTSGFGYYIYSDNMDVVDILMFIESVYISIETKIDT